MKRFIPMVLALLLLSSAAMAADPDPIVGVWYANMVMADAPQMDEYRDYIRAVMILTFEENGNITFKELDFKGTGFEEPAAAVIGKWEKNNVLTYKTRIIGAGEKTAYLKSDILYASVTADDVHIMFRRMTPLDWYTDIKSF